MLFNSYQCLRSKIEKMFYNLLWETIFQAFLHVLFYIFPFFTPGKQPYFEINEMTTHTPCARDIWWTLDFASAFHFPGVNSRTEFVPSPRAYGRNGVLRRSLGNKVWSNTAAPILKDSFISRNILLNNYNLRNSQTDLILPKPNREFLKRIFKYKGAYLWNNLPLEAKQAQSIYNYI
jgi:hypothetical protein